MSCGDHFVETLRKVGYTKAPNLEGEDFDWLFETENRAFLDWFCATATEQSVLNDEKLQAFNSLKESGKGILDEKALEELLKTCKPANSKLSAMEEVPIDKLQEELEALQKQKTLYINRRNKLQMMASSNSHLCLKFKDKEEEDSKLLNEKLSDLKITNDKLNHELKSVIEGVEKLIAFFSVPEAGCELQYEPVFLSQVVLDKYLSHEEQSTATLTLFTKEHFYNGFSKITESETFQPAGLNANSSSSDDTEDKCKEMMRLQLAYICAKNKLIQVKAKNESLKAGLQWVEDNVCAVQSKASDKEENMKTRISSLRNEVSQIQNHVDQINSETLPKLVREGAQLLTMPVVKGDYDQQITLQEMHIAKQDLICNHLMKQKTSFELLLLGYELELRKHRDVSRQLKTVIQDLQMISESVEKRLTLLNDASLSSTAKSRNNIDSKDSSSHRLSDLLEDNKMQKLFRTYSGLESVAQKLTKDIASLKDQLIVSKQEQSIVLAKLDADLKSLSDFMYPKGKTVLLNTPELSSEFQLLESQLEKLNHIIVEVLGDLKAKRNILESGKLHKMEKELYVYFFKNKDHLRNIVENLESQAEILSST